LARHQFLLFHTVVELLGIAVGWSVFLLLWNARNLVGDKAFTFLGAVYLLTGFLDLLHTVSYKGMGLFPGAATPNLATQLWVAGRLLETAGLVAFPLLLGRRFSLPAALTALALGAGGLLVSIFLWPVFPDCFVEGSGLTPFKKAAEYALCGALALSLWLLWRRRRDLGPDLYVPLALATALRVGAEFAFTTYASVYGPSNQLGHNLRLAAALFVYLGLVRGGLTKPYSTLFRAFRQSEDARHAALDQLEEGETLYRGLFEHAPDGIVTLSGDGLFLYVNESYCRMTGYRREELLQTSAFEVYAGSAAGGTEGSPLSSVLEGNEVAFETPVRRKDGTVVSAEVIAWRSHFGTIQAVVKDVTERNRTAETLRATELRQRVALEAAGMGTWEWDLATDVIVWSDAHEALMGYAPGTFPGTVAGFLDRVHPDDRDRLRRTGELAVAKRESFQTEFRVVRPDGSVAWVRSHGRYVFDDGERPTQVVGVALDVTARKLAEDLERVQRELATHLAATSDLGEGLGLCLGAALEFSGFTAGGVYLRDGGTGALDLAVHRGLSAAFVEGASHYPAGSRHAELVAAGAPVYERYGDLPTAPAEAAQGEALRFLGVVPLAGDDGVVGCLNVASHDAHRVAPQVKAGLESIAATATNAVVRLRAQALLREREALFSSIVEQAMDAVAVVDSETARFVEFNTAAHEGLGYTREEFARLTILDIQAEHSPEEIRRNVELLRTEGKFAFETKHRCRDGEVRDEYVRAKALRLGGREYAATVWTDVTASKAAERERQQLEKQYLDAQKMEAVGTLAAGIAHDFNNILQPIVAYSELALFSLDDADPVREYLSEILAASGRATSLVRQILDLSRRHDEGEVRVNLGLLLKESSKFLRASIPSSIEILTDVDASCGSVEGDPARLHQVILNLCTNARDAMAEKGGVLALSLKRVETGRLRLRVADTGTGMPPEVAARIFEPYFTTKRRGEGTGLGLATARSIVDRLGGEIVCRSEPGAGTTFDVFLPEVAPSQEPAAAKPEADPSLGKGRCVLVVDDDGSILKLLEVALVAVDFAPVLCRSPEEALRAFSADPGRFDAVFTDYTMPGMSGLELAERLHEVRPEVPVLLGTGLAEGVDETVLRQKRIRALLLKPFSAGDLAAALADALGPEA
ncbi:MAG: PAS domain S-box protein, partial [Deltaproteobacteria bacterium]|nr:PAS domain S-box protein [Deltaproteobacteria bacterium]